MKLGLFGPLACALVLAACGSGEDGSPSSPGGPAPDSTAPGSTAAPLEITSTTWDDGTFTLSDGAPTQDWGVAAAPTTGGPHPVVVLLHGNHPTCPTDTGGGTWPCPAGTE